MTVLDLQQLPAPEAQFNPMISTTSLIACPDHSHISVNCG
jgi:hypothetical protein